MENLLAPKLDQMQTDLKSFVERHLGKSAELDARLRQLEQAFVSGPGSRGAPMGIGGEKSLGDVLIESDGFAAFKKGARSSGQIEVGSFHRKAVTITSGSLVGPDFRPVVAAPGMARLTLRDLIPSYQTVSNLVTYPFESAATNAADYQVNEGDAKAQSDFTYTLQQAAVCTLAHWIAASKQMVDDSVAFNGYVNNRLLYMLQAKTERELIYGSGAGGRLHGIALQATAATGAPTNLIDATAAAIAQLAAVGFYVDGIVCHPNDWWATRVLKASGTGNYLIGSPLDPLAPTLWGLSVSLSLAINPGHFLVGVFRNECGIFDRQQATLEISREHASFFTQNLVAILAEERNFIS